MTWASKKDLPWCKVYDRWFTSLSHLDLDDTTLLVGIRMMLLANQRGRRPDGSGHVVNGSGQPISIEGIARAAHSTPDRVRTSIAELVSVETLQDLGGGLYSFPNLQIWQETPDAERKRKARAQRLEMAEDETPDDIFSDVERSPLNPSSSDTSPDFGPDSPQDCRPDVRTRGSEDQRIRGSEDQTADPVRTPGSPSGDLFEAPEPTPTDTILIFGCKPSARSPQPFWPLTRRKLAEWGATYAAIDVEAEARRCWQYFQERPSKRKTFGGWPAALTYWLSSEDKRARERGPGRPWNGSTSPLPPKLTEE